MNKLRITLIILVCISLPLVLFYSIVNFISLGFSGGEFGKYSQFYGYFCCIYLIIVIGTLLRSRHLNKFGKPKYSLYLLFLPFISLLPYAYVGFRVQTLESEYQKQHFDHHPTANDYVCSPGKFIRDESYRYMYFDYDPSYSSGSRSDFYNKGVLLNHLWEIGISECKNEQGKIFQ